MQRSSSPSSPSSATDPSGGSAEPDLDAACRAACALLGTPAALAVLTAAAGNRVVGRCGIGEAEAEAVAGSAAFRDLLGGEDGSVVRDPWDGTRSCTVAALHADDGSFLGILCAIDAADRPDPDAQARALLLDVARLAGAALQVGEAERRRAESEGRLWAVQAVRGIVERTARAGHLRIDAAARTVAWSAGVASVFGRNATLEPIDLDAHFADYHPDDRAAVRERIEAALAGRSRLPRGGYAHRSRILRPDGEVRHVSVEGVAERDAAGRIIAIHGICLDVTDPARSEQELRETTALLQATLEAMDQGLVMIDAEDRIRVHNRRVADMIGVPETLLYDGAPFEAVRRHQTEQGEFARLPNPLRRWLEQSEAAAAPREFERERPDGTVLQVRALPVATGGIVRTFTDVTARRTAEATLRESERRYRLITENASDVIILSDLDTTRRYVSPVVTAVLGYAPEDLIGTRPLDFVHPDDTAEYARILDDVCHGRAQRALTVQRYRHRDGRWIWVELTFGLTHDPETGYPDGYVATLRDVTARIAAEEAIREGATRERALAEERLREALARTNFTTAASAAILAQLAEGVIVTDAAGRITLVNAAAAAIHGVGRLDVEPEAYSDTYHLFTEDGRPYPPRDLPLARAVRGETVRDARWRIRRPDGADVLAIGNAQPLIGPDGAQIGAVLTVRDDTARDAAEGALLSLNATLSERVAERTREADAARDLAEAGSRAKSEFLASMSHEIRTPLNGVIGYADLLLDDPAIDARVRQYGERIRSAGAALLTVVNDILDVSKVEAGQIEIAPRPFALAALIDNTMSIVRGLADAKGLALGAALDPGPVPWLVGDEDRLRQVLLNLLNNAIKFTPQGRVDLRVSVHADAGPQAEPGPVRVRFSVTDTGIGIPADKRDRLFRRFSQVDGSYRRPHEGTGLGLSICKSLVELMGGALEVESAEARGSIFRFEVVLPLAAAPEARAPDGAAGPARPSCRLLLAEDVTLNQELACALLRAAGHTVDVVADGAQAVRAVQAEPYDLVLMDVQMPVMDGVSATRCIRALDGPVAALPIIALTANVLPQQVAEFREAGMNDHVGKPFVRATLLDAIERWALRDRGPAGTGASPEPCSIPAGRIASPDPRSGALPRAQPAPAPADSAPSAGIPGNRGLDAVADAVGADRIAGLLAILAEELDARFGPSAPVPDRDRLAQEAHAMIAATSMLGFEDLARLCRAVEEACRTGGDYGPLLATLREQTARVIAAIETLRAA